MIQLKYEVVRNQAFQQALSKLLHYPRFSLLIAKRIAKIVQAVREAGDKAQERFAAVVKAHAHLDEHGEIAPNEGVKGTFKIIPEKFDDFQKAIEAMESETFDVDVDMLAEQDMTGVELSANELMLLEPLFAMNEIGAPVPGGPQLELAEAPAH